MMLAERMSDTGLRIRRGQPADAGPLAAFAARLFFETFAADNRPQDLAAHVASSFGERQQALELADPDIITLLIDGPTGIAGYAQIRRHGPPPCVDDVGAVELWRFYVDRPWQGRGIAPRLMAEARIAASALGGRTVWLSVWERNARAIAFYAKCGFQDAGSHPFWVGADRQMDRIMTADVDEPKPG
jgi:ribosomal protein S18 acetylase RimI-like enzyme